MQTNQISKVFTSYFGIRIEKTIAYVQIEIKDSYYKIVEMSVGKIIK